MYSEICGYTIYYEISGDAEKEWLILLHGIAGSTKCWKYQLDDFNKHFRVLSLDLAGHGNSSPLSIEKYSGELIANQLRVLMEELQISKAHILGLSLGTIILQYFCEMFPEKVISVILASPVSKPNYISAIFNSFTQKIFLKIFKKNIYLRLMSLLMLPGKAHERSRKFFLSETLKMNGTEFTKWIRLATKGDHYYYISPSHIPALIVAGEKDFCYFNDAVMLKEKYLNNQFKVIKDAGHVFIFQKPAEFNNMVIGFINSLTGKDACTTPPEQHSEPQEDKKLA